MNRQRWSRHLLVVLLVAGVSSGLGGRPTSPLSAAVAAAQAPIRTSVRPQFVVQSPSLRPTRDRTQAAGAAATVGAASGVTWTQQVEITSTAQTANDAFGAAVAVSGDTAVVGAQDTPAPAHFGAAYIFIRQGTIWTQQAELSDPAGVADDQFGYAVALNSETLVIGAPGAAGLSTATGAAYVYGRSGGVWALQATLSASDGAFNDGFGSSVAISGTTVVVGAPDKNSMSGAAYVFTRQDTTWTQQAALGDPAGAFAEFGYAVTVSGNTAVISAAQAPDAYVYVRSGGVWTQQAALHAPAPGRYFGVAVALSGNTALVSACCLATHVTGLVYVFGRSSSAWTLQAALKPPTGSTNFVFGTAVALSGHTAVVGGDSAYMFVGGGSTWSAPAQLIPSDRAANQMGAAVSVQGPTVLVGATAAPAAAYVFVRSVAASADPSDDAPLRHDSR